MQRQPSVALSRSPLTVKNPRRSPGLRDSRRRTAHCLAGRRPAKPRNATQVDNECPRVVGDDRLAARAVVERRQDAQPLGAAHTSLNRPMRHPERPSNRVTDGVSRYSSSFCATRPGWPAPLVIQGDWDFEGSFDVRGEVADALELAARIARPHLALGATFRSVSPELFGSARNFCAGSTR